MSANFVLSARLLALQLLVTQLKMGKNNRMNWMGKNNRMNCDRKTAVEKRPHTEAGLNIAQANTRMFDIRSRF
jgi:hypothetical protein